VIVILKIILGTFFTLLFLLSAYQTLKMKSIVNMILYLVIELILTAVMIWGSFWIIDANLKKAEMTKFTNTRLLSSEELMIQGYVRNVGKYTINHVYLKIKLINAVSGKSRDILRNRDGSKKANTLIKKFVVATNLRVGEQRKFHARLKYPSYFRLSDIIPKLSWD